MKIIEARTIVVGTPWRELAFLELATDEGLVGLSEARMVNKTSTLLACIDELAPRYVIGTDPFDVERLAWNVLRAEYGRAGEIAQSALASFTFGGSDLGDLYITTALVKLTERERAEQPQAGGVFRVRPGPKGRPPNRFKG